MGLGGSAVCGVFTHDFVYLFEFLAGEGEEETGDEAEVCCLMSENREGGSLALDVGIEREKKRNILYLSMQ